MRFWKGKKPNDYAMHCEYCLKRLEKSKVMYAIITEGYRDCSAFKFCSLQHSILFIRKGFKDCLKKEKNLFQYGGTLTQTAILELKK